MKQYFVTDANNLVIARGTTQDLKHAHCDVGQTAHAGDAKLNSVFNAKTNVFTDTPTYILWQQIGNERNEHLLSAGKILAELLLPDSFPKLTVTQKKDHVDAITTYRQDLRDITKQPDPAHIVWPTPPGAI